MNNALFQFAKPANEAVKEYRPGRPERLALEKELEKLRFNLNDLISELRFNGQADISNVEVAVVETSGKLSVIPKDENAPSNGLPCMVISDGSFNDEELIRSGHSKVYIKEKLKEQGIEAIKDVFIAVIDENDNVFVQKKQKR